MPDSPPRGPIITRFAPSPTGHLHIGGARSALFCWAFAKRAELEHRARGGAAGEGGRFMIRIEDTDQARSSEESARGILEDLAWLGIQWDDGPVLRVARLSEPGGSAAGHSSGSESRTTNSSGSESRTTQIGANSRPVGPYFQAQRKHLYNAYIESLVKAGRAYAAFESSEEIDALRKEYVARKQTFKYPRPADVQLGVFNEARWMRALAGERHVIRFAMDAQPVVVQDQVLGDVKIAIGEVDDFVIRKADDFPTYHFAVVIDDELMGVTHVMRAQEHLANTPRHVAMQRALKRLDTGENFRTPVYAHMPLIFNMDGTKMSKRDKAKAARTTAKKFVAEHSITELLDRVVRVFGERTDWPSTTPAERLDNLQEFLAAKSDSLFFATAISRALGVPLPEIEVNDFREGGYLPEAIINFLSLLGWTPGMKLADGKDLEKFGMEFLARNFAIDRIGKANAKFDRAKLLSFNADAIGALSDAEFASRWRAFLAEYEPAALASLDARGPAAALILAAVTKPRAKTLRDALTAARFALTSDTDYPFDPKSLDKLRAPAPSSGPNPNLSPSSLLSSARQSLSTIPASSWAPPTIHAALESLAASLNLGADNAASGGIGKLAQPLRVAVTGSGISPGIAETLAILGQPSSLARIDRCLAQLASMP